MTPLKGGVARCISTAATAAAATMTSSENQRQWAVPDFEYSSISSNPAVLSPTQVPANERVVQSIFSRPFPVSSSNPKENEQQQQQQHFFTPQETIASTPKRTRKDEKNRFENNDIFFPANQAGKNLSPLTITSALSESRVGPSPSRQPPPPPPPPPPLPPPPRQQQKQQNRHHHHTDKMSTSSTTLKTIHMLNFGFIEKSTSVSDLEKVVRFLATHRQKTKHQQYSPQLLQAASDRIAKLNEAQQHHEQQPSVATPPSHHNIMLSTPKSSEGGEEEESSVGGDYFFSNVALNNISRINTTMDSNDRSRSTLNMSLSPGSDTLQGTALVETPRNTTAVMDTDTVAAAVGMSTIFPQPGGLTSNARLKPIVEDQSPSFFYDNDREKLSDEMKKLSEQAMEIENSGFAEQKSFVLQLEELKEVDKSAEELMKNLESSNTNNSNNKNLKQRGSSSNAPPPPPPPPPTQDLVKQIEKIRKERKETQKALDEERAALKKRNKEAMALEKRLKEKISKIERELKTSEEHSRLAVGAERGLRMKREQELTKQTQRAADLNRTLQETKNNLESLRRKHSQFRLELLRSIGASCTELKELSQENFITEFSKKVKAMKEENEAMSAALKEANQSNLAEDNARLNKHLQSLVSTKAKLEEENRKLSAKIKEHLEELTSSRAYIDKLLKTSHETQLSDWEKKEAQYKTVIQNLRNQVRKQVPTVSIELYKAAVDGGKTTEAELKRATEKISDLESKISHLEKERLETRILSGNAKTPNKKPDLLCDSGFMSPLESGLLSGLSIQASPPKKPFASPKNINHQSSVNPHYSYPFRDSQDPLRRAERAGTKDKVGPDTEHVVETPLSQSPRRIRRIVLPLADLKASAPTDDLSRDKLHRKNSEADINSSSKQRIEQRLTGQQNAAFSWRDDPNLPSARKRSNDSLLEETKEATMASLSEFPDDRNRQAEMPSPIMEASLPPIGNTVQGKNEMAKNSQNPLEPTKQPVGESLTLERTHNVIPRGSFWASLKENRIEGCLGSDPSHYKAAIQKNIPVESIRRTRLPLASIKASSPRIEAPKHTNSPKFDTVNPTKQVDQNVIDSYPEATTQKDRRVSSNRRAGLPLASMKASSPFVARTPDLTGQSPVSEAITPMQQQVDRDLMGMTISFPRDDSHFRRDSFRGALSPLPVTGLDREMTKEKQGTLKSDNKKSNVDVLDWVDNYNSESNTHIPEATCKQNLLPVERRSSTKSRINDIKGGKKKKGDHGKDGLKGNSKKLQVFDESDILQAITKLNGTSKKSMTDSSSTPPETNKLASQSKSSTKRHEMTPSVKSTNKFQKENETPTKTSSKSRAVKIREMGGRKGLQEKLKKIRSPPPKSRPFRPLAVN